MSLGNDHSLPLAAWVDFVASLQEPPDGALLAAWRRASSWRLLLNARILASDSGQMVGTSFVGFCVYSLDTVGFLPSCRKGRAPGLQSSARTSGIGS